MASYTIHKPNKYRKVYKWNSHLHDTVYLSPTDYINKYKYRLIDIPDNTAQVSEYELSPYTVGPIRNPYPHEVSTGMFTINWMINAYHNHIPFTFDRSSDICHAAWKLGDYVDLLTQQIDNLNDNAKSYLEKAQIFLSVLDKSAVRVIRKHGKEHIVREQLGLNFIDELISSQRDIYTQNIDLSNISNNRNQTASALADILHKKYA